MPMSVGEPGRTGALRRAVLRNGAQLRSATPARMCVGCLGADKNR